METVWPPLQRPHIAIEAASPLSTVAELSVVRAAFQRRPSPAMRRKLASLLSRLADWSGLIDLLDPQYDLSPDEGLLLAAAWLELHGGGGLAGADQALNRLNAANFTAAQRSAELVLRARIATLNRDSPKARASLLEALTLDPANRAACIRLARIELGAGRASAALALVERLEAQGVSHPYVAAVRALGHASSGDRSAARQAMGTDILAATKMIEPPVGWNDIDSFNAALAGELLAHPDLRYQRYGASPVPSWGIDAPLAAEASLLGALLSRIADMLRNHIAALSECGHPWAQARPTKATLHCSCVMTEASDFEDWHIHPTGWLNGVYYVQIPDGISEKSDAGCLAFGLPAELIGAGAADSYGRQIICPRGGIMVAFPSHTYHRTFAHGCEGRRIAVTFELRPG